MFAIPGILALIFLIYVRPQEVVVSLQSVPWLYLFFGLALFGMAVDVKRRINRAGPVPQLVWVALYWLWSMVTVAIHAPAQLSQGALLLTIPLLLFGLVSQGLQTFRGLGLLAALLFCLSMFLGALGTHQAQAGFGCAMVNLQSASDLSVGVPDGRPCEQELDCYRGDPEPGADYMCERVGLLETTSVGGGRVRYRGILQDPNEMALAMTLGLMLGLGVILQKPTPSRVTMAVVASILVATAVYFTRSRSGQLSLLIGFFVFAVHRFRWKAIVFAIIVGGPVLVALAAGSGRADADSSTEERLEAWSTALELFRGSPLWGVGAGQFTEHHYLTAHNSFLLAAAETGALGVTLWVTVLYASFKIPITALRRYAAVPQAKAAVAWSIATLAALCPMVVGSSFISWTTHEILWIHLGISGALYSTIRSHDSHFVVRIRVVEVLGMAALSGVLLVVLQLYLRLKGF